MKKKVTLAPVSHLSELVIWGIGAYIGDEYMDLPSTWQIHLFEPNPEPFAKLKKWAAPVENVHVYNKAVINDDRPTVDFYIPTKFGDDQPWGKQVAGLTTQVAEHHQIETKKITVPAVNSKTLAMLTGSEPDVLVIDTEGFDDQLIHLAQKYKPYVVQYEFLHLNENRTQAAFNKMKESGYIPFYKNTMDIYWKQKNSAIPSL